MRTKPSWSDCFPLQIYWTWIVAGLIAGALLLFTECSPREAHAELYVDVAGGLAQFMVTAPDGDYLQRGLPRSLDLRSLAYRVGLGYRFNERWAIQGSYVNFGTLNQTAKFVSDEDYSAKGSACIKNCATAPTYRITDKYHGGELTVSRTWEHIYLKAGMAYLMHGFTINREDGTGQSNQHYGQFLSTVAGLGWQHGPFYLEADYYHGLGGSNGFLGSDNGWPLSKEQVVAWFGLRIPFGG